MSGVAAAMVAGSVITSRSQERSARRARDQAAEAAAPVPISTPLFFTDVDPETGRVTARLTGQGQGLLGGALSDFRSIPLSSITQPGFNFGESDRDLLGRADQIDARADQFFNRAGSSFDRADSFFDRSNVAFDRAQTPEASLGFLERAFGPQLAQARAAQENRLFNQGLLGSTAGGLQTEALSRGQQGALLEGALQQQQFQGQLGQALGGLGTNIGSLGVNQGALGQGLLGSALNTRQLFSNINLARQSQDLAERQFLNQARSGSLAAALGLLEAPGSGASITLGGQGNAGAAAQAAAIGAQGAANRQNAIMSGITSAGLGLLGTQQPTQTIGQPMSRTSALSGGSFLPSTRPTQMGSFGGVSGLSFLNR